MIAIIITFHFIHHYRSHHQSRYRYHYICHCHYLYQYTPLCDDWRGDGESAAAAREEVANQEQFVSEC